MNNIGKIIIILQVLACLPVALAQSIHGKGEMHREFYEYNKKQSLYGSAPLTHINPKLNNITYALSLSRPDYLITPNYTDSPFSEDPNIGTEMKLSGWDVSPHLAVSLRNIGIGFSVGRGEKSVEYQNINRYISPASITSQASKLAYGDFGLFMYFVPFPKVSSSVRAAIILAGKNINAKHVLSPMSNYQEGGSSFQADKVYRYNVNEVSTGLNIKISLLRRFSIIPWADYNYVDTSVIDNIASDEARLNNATELTDLQNDLEMFWHSKPKFRYGIDFAVNISRLEISIGGLFGALAQSANQEDFIQDSAYTINFAFHQKGN